LRIAVSGSHGTGKSTLIRAFLERRPHYRHEPEAYEALADDIDLTPSEGPTPEGLQALLEHTVGAVDAWSSETSVVFERSPVDYLAYALASRTWPRGAAAEFLEAYVPQVRRSLRGLDVIAYVPVSRKGPDARAGENPRFRLRVDEELRRALLDDDHDLFGGAGSPRVRTLPPDPQAQLDELVGLSGAAGPD